MTVQKKLAIVLEFTEAELNAIATSMTGLPSFDEEDEELEMWVNEVLDEKLRSLGAYGDVPDDEPAPYSESNPPKSEDVVRIPDGTLAFVLRSLHGEWLTRAANGSIGSYHFSTLEFLYRPPQGE